MENNSYFDKHALMQESVGHYNCNINREKIPFKSFDSMRPYYDNENGLHLKVGENSDQILKLDHELFKNIKFSNNLTNNEVFDLYIKNRNVFVDNLLKNIYSKGFDVPSPVQSLTIPFLIQGRDCIVQFKSGTGKTLSFVIGSLYGFDLEDDSLQYVYITSSHEVATQIFELIKFLLPVNAKVTLAIGNKTVAPPDGGFIQKQPRSTSRLDRKSAMEAQIIVGTVGKIYDYMTNDSMSILNTRNLKAIILDEFDQLLETSVSRSAMSLSTQDQVVDIFREYVPSKAQRIFFSATLSQQLVLDCETFLRIDDRLAPDDEKDLYNPFLCLMDATDYAVSNISQYYQVVYSTDDKKDMISYIYSACAVAQSIIFCNKINDAEDLQRYLLDSKLQLNSSIFHGKLTSSERKQVVDNFVQSRIRCLISTDVTARGFDVQGINLVVNYDMPKNKETYIHRIGRSGRYGRKGVAINLVLDNEMRTIDQIRQISENSVIQELPSRIENLL